MDFDYIIIGSGFGGSVSAMRLSEKGYRVLVIEKGKWWKSEDFPKSNWNLPKFLWFPLFRWFGIMKMSFFKKVLVLSGTGVGGGSLVYANTHMIPEDHFWKSPNWNIQKDWKNVLLPFYEKAKKMLGSTSFDKEFYEDQVLKEVASEMGKLNSFKSVDYVGVYFSENKEFTDPYFNGEGPMRKPCIECAGCMIGCRHDAKNTLDKNYLWFAQKFGAQILSETLVYKIEYLDGKYTIHTKSQTNLWKQKNQIFTSNGLICSAGVLGTLKLLLTQRDLKRTLPKLSQSLGENILTNSEMIAGIGYSPNKLNHGIAISKIFKPDNETYIELCKYPDGSGAMVKLGVLATAPGSPLIRTLKMIFQMLTKPKSIYRILFSKNTARHSIILLIMQSLPSALKLKIKSNWIRSYLSFDQNFETNVPSYIPIGQTVMNQYAQKTKGIPLNSFSEVMFGMSTTAHIMGGCPIGSTSKEGVVNEFFRVHEYPNMYIIDGSIIPANLGVNPSLTITALAEYAMDSIPMKLISKPSN